MPNCPACGTKLANSDFELCSDCETAYKERQEADEQEFCEQMQLERDEVIQ